MRILCCGDVVGKSGRVVVFENLPALRKELDLDFVVVNGENAAHGFGITERMCKAFYDVGADVVTTGNHVWDQREIMNYIDSDPKLLRPINFPWGTPGAGHGVFNDRNGRRILVIHPMGRLFMDPIDDPFFAVDKVLKEYRLGDNIDAVIVDFHADITSEKMAMGHHCDGRVSVVVGTHSHVPTADAQVLPGGTAYQTDLGMCGDYDSVIGMIKTTATERFTTKVPTGRLEPAEGEATLCAALIDVDDTSGLAISIQPLRIGGRLLESRPKSAT